MRSFSWPPSIGNRRPFRCPEPPAVKNTTSVVPAPRPSPYQPLYASCVALWVPASSRSTLLPVDMARNDFVPGRGWFPPPGDMLHLSRRRPSIPAERDEAKFCLTKHIPLIVPARTNRQKKTLPRSIHICSSLSAHPPPPTERSPTYITASRSRCDRSAHRIPVQHGGRKLPPEVWFPSRLLHQRPLFLSRTPPSHPPFRLSSAPIPETINTNGPHAGYRLDTSFPLQNLTSAGPLFDCHRLLFPVLRLPQYSQEPCPIARPLDVSRYKVGSSRLA